MGLSVVVMFLMSSLIDRYSVISLDTFSSGLVGFQVLIPVAMPLTWVINQTA